MFGFQGDCAVYAGSRCRTSHQSPHNCYICSAWWRSLSWWDERCSKGESHQSCCTCKVPWWGHNLSSTAKWQICYWWASGKALQFQLICLFFFCNLSWLLGKTWLLSTFFLGFLKPACESSEDVCQVILNKHLTGRPDLEPLERIGHKVT